MRVDAINGKKIYAGGKWLTCIGNKSVHVGECIWTDGRCVYGFFKESQTPIVITTPKKKEDWAVPILFCPKYRDNKGDLYIFKNGAIEKIGELTPSDNRKTPIFLINNEKSLNIGSKYVITEVEGEGDNWSSKQTYTLATNLNSQGVFYELRKSRMYQFSDNKAFCFGSVDILKNGKVIKTLDFTDESKKIMSRVASYASSATVDNGVESFQVTYHNEENVDWHGLPEGFGLGDVAMSLISRVVTAGGYYITTVRYTLQKHSEAQEPYVHIPWGVIEDENNWALIICLSCEGHARGFGMYPDGTYRWYWDRIYHNDTYATFYESYLITPSGATPIYTGQDTWITNNNVTTHNTSGEPTPPLVNLPIQNGYYFVINNLRSVDTRSHEQFPLQMDVSIFNPKGNQIANGTFPTGTYFTIYKDSLLGVDDRGGYGFIDRDIYNMGKLKDSVSGLYEIKKGSLNKFADGYIKNDKLHPFKNSKKLKQVLNSFAKEGDEE